MNNKLINFALLLFLAFASRASVPYGTAPPILFTHCRHDTVVPIASPMKLAREMTGLRLHSETYFYDLGRKNQGHAIWDVSDKKRHVLYPDIRERRLKFLRDVRDLPQPPPFPIDHPLKD